MIESPYDAVEASRCALDRMAKTTAAGCDRKSEGCRWCEHPVRVLLNAVREYIDNPMNRVSISNYQKGSLI